MAEARNAPGHSSPQKPDERCPRRKVPTKFQTQPPHPAPRTGIQAGKPRRSPPHKLNHSSPLADRRPSPLGRNPNHPPLASREYDRTTSRWAMRHEVILLHPEPSSQNSLSTARGVRGYRIGRCLRGVPGGPTSGPASRNSPRRPQPPTTRIVPSHEERVTRYVLHAAGEKGAG